MSVGEGGNEDNLLVFSRAETCGAQNTGGPLIKSLSSRAGLHPVCWQKPIPVAGPG
jgi:hypothetical protein